MNKIAFIRLVTIIFFVIGIIHLYRGFVGLPLTLGTWQAPLYISFIESFVFFVLAYLGHKHWN